MNESQFLSVLKPYYEAFAEHDPSNRLRLLRESMTPDAEIWGPKRVFAGYEQISEKIAGFHHNWPGCRLVLDTGLNVFLNTARIGGAILGPDGAVRATAEAVVELAADGRIQRVVPFWDALPSLPASWPRALAGPSRQGTGSSAAALILEEYFRAKDGNRPHVLERVFTSDARLEINNSSTAIAFPAVAQGIEAVANVLVRDFGRTNENVYSFYLSKPEGVPRQFNCAWLVGMTDKHSKQVRVGCGTYEWSFVYEPPPRADGLIISIDVMELLPPAAAPGIVAWLEQLPYPWATATAALNSAPHVEGLSPVLAALSRNFA